MPVAACDNVTGLILAGGPGAHMAGTDKGLVELRGRPLVAHAIERLTPQVASVMISANRNLERYRSFGPRVFRDAGGLGIEYPGPLAGIEAGLAHAQTAWVAVVPCDAPNFPETLVPRLADALNERGVTAACARVDGRLQPVFCLLAVMQLPSLRDYISRGGWAVYRWLETAGAAAVDFEETIAFQRFSTSEALLDGR